MDDGEVPDHYYTFEGRLASFQASQPVSGRKRGPKTLAWPHKGLDENSLARAGFYFEPTADKPDNVVCYLCHARIGGWEDDDNPLEEHLRLSPHCGWAIVTAIEAGLGDYNMDDPSHPDMMEARKQTFAKRWPHEGKRAWKCKTKQMVDAGWKYTPTIDSDDMATCTYCQLALDGWEPADKPMNEHYRRSPECPFFRLIDQYQQGPLKKTVRGKAVRTSKASRLSGQSVATFASEAPSTLADYEDSVMTTTSVVTAGGTKKTRAKKATTTRAKKTRGKKDEPIEVLEDPPEDEIPPPPPPKPTRGRKRASDSVDDSVLTNAEAPAPKKRATRTRQSNNVDASIVESHADQSMVDAVPAPPAKTTQKKPRASRAKNAQKMSTTSTASAVSIPDEAEIPNDEEIDRQLQEDLDRQLSEDEAIAADSDSERRKAPAAKPKAKKAPAKKKSTASNKEQPLSDHAMFDPTPVEVDDADVSAELKAMRANMEAEEASTLQVPKKGRKAAGTTRKVSKQTKAQKAKAQQEAELEPEQEPELEPETAAAPAAAPKTIPAPAQDMSEDELSFNATVLTTASAPAKKRGRPKKNSTQPPPPVEEPKPKPPTKYMAHVDFSDDVQMSSTPRPVKPTHEREVSPSPAPEISQTPATPKPVISPAPAARQSAISPSQSPQASDEENQPPSSKPSNTANSSRVAMDPVDATPAPSSPSKRNANVLHGLESTQPWTEIDLDMVFQDLNKENAGPASQLQKGAQLTTPEKKMTVEEWINHNAGLAEERLKNECETMVSKFEQEGGRAMRVLEELVTAE
ncbi:inhibitor of apoptosis domain-containing protein [Apiospora arundinis]|uniref:Inhibitor of apoptosis domain-containing protein n=1 Tax=Apiospora arundinis TaxID=335852 RepID=A0ABR2IUC2_9PEZI